MTKTSRNNQVDQQIDDNLRRVYSEAFEEPVPERFTKLLDQLRAKEQESSDTRNRDSETKTEDDA
ncbi:MAG: NepR family anti-sigma factor [Roseovarius sp.]